MGTTGPIRAISLPPIRESRANMMSFKGLEQMNLFGNLGGLFSSDMAIDLGTANTLVYVKGKGIILSLSLIHI